MNQEEKVLRQYVRKKISKMIREQEEKEFQLRQVIRKLLKEGDISDVHPHRSTAINTLEDVLKKAIPTLRKDYKNLTTDKSQRESFRAHILKAMKDVVAPAMNNAKYGDGGTLLSEPPALGGEEAPEEVEDETWVISSTYIISLLGVPSPHIFIFFLLFFFTSYIFLISEGTK